MTIDNHVLPRRGTAREPYVPDPEALDELRHLLRTRSEYVRSVVAAPHSDRELMDAASAYLGGAADPLGAAVAVRTAAAGSGDRPFDRERLADAWIGEHGVAFAAAAVAELSTIRLAVVDAGGIELQRAYVGDWETTHQATIVRRVLATAGDADHAAAVEALAGRRGTVTQREPSRS